MCVQKILHLFPLWSCLLQSDVTRLAIDTTNNDDQSSGRCLSNGTVEAHFKNLKHGRIGNQLKVRPRALVEAELQFVIGKLNELDLPETARTGNEKLRNKKGRQEIGLTTERWEKKPRKKKSYRNPEVIVRTLTAKKSLPSEKIRKLESEKLF